MSQFVPLKVKSITPQTDQAICIAFDVVPEQQEQFQFQPGQHLTIRHLTEAGEIRRCYSICSYVHGSNEHSTCYCTTEWSRIEIRNTTCTDMEGTTLNCSNTFKRQL